MWFNIRQLFLVLVLSLSVIGFYTVVMSVDTYAGEESSATSSDWNRSKSDGRNNYSINKFVIYMCVDKLRYLSVR